MNADYSKEFSNALHAAYYLYPSIDASIESISVCFEMPNGLGKLSIKEYDFHFGFNAGLMSLDTVHHEVAHMVCHCLDLPLDHGKEFLMIKDNIARFCQNYSAHS